MDEIPYGARRYLNLPKGVMNVVRSWLSSSRGHWWYPLRASSFVNTFAFSEAISATACAGVGHWYLSLLTYLFKCERSTHILILSVPFFVATTMGAHHSVGSVTGCDDVLLLEEFQLRLELLSKSVGDGPGGMYAEGLRIIC